jgi:hypothetical protein
MAHGDDRRRDESDLPDPSALKPSPWDCRKVDRHDLDIEYVYHQVSMAWFTVNDINNRLWKIDCDQTKARRAGDALQLARLDQDFTRLRHRGRQARRELFRLRRWLLRLEASEGGRPGRGPAAGATP